MGSALSALLAGLLFGAGLALAEMTNPAKIQNFLDVFGTWDPSLACVMGAALAVSALGVQWARRRGASRFGGTLTLPSRRDVDARLVGGAALFGVGWGLGGFCPGPSLAGLLQGVPGVWIFVASMLVGMAIESRWPQPAVESAEETT